MKMDEELEFEINKALTEKDTANQLYRENIFYDIIELNISYLNVLDNYFSIEKEKKPTEVKPGVYFDMKLISLIHNECNNIQFENISELDLYTLLNLQPTNAKLNIKSGEKARMSFLISKLYDYLKTDNQMEWRTAIIESAGIDEGYYQSKYKEPASEFPSKKSKEFAECINKIFQYLS
jgi:hypothetical protein